MRDKVSGFNFAFLVRVELTEPIENTSEYAFSIATITNTLGGGKPLLQRLGDLKRGRRSTWRRLKRSNVVPTFSSVTPGDIAMALPHRLIVDIIEGLEALDKVIPGIASDSTLLYAPEIKLYAMRVEVDNGMQTSIDGLYVAGDGAGVSRGIVGAAATGIIAARDILKRRTNLRTNYSPADNAYNITILQFIITANPSAATGIQCMHESFTNITMY